MTTGETAGAHNVPHARFELEAVAPGGLHFPRLPAGVRGAWGSAGRRRGSGLGRWKNGGFDFHLPAQTQTLIKIAWAAGAAGRAQSRL